MSFSRCVTVVPFVGCHFVFDSTRISKVKLDILTLVLEKILGIHDSMTETITSARHKEKDL